MRKRDLWLIIGAVVMALILGGALMVGRVIETGSWGLSFRTEGEAPIGNASGAALARYDAVYVGDTTQKVLYLTFDAGYENGYTADILDTLQKHGVSATFFLVGNYIERAPDLVRRMVAEGHTVGNHTMHHYDMSKIAEKDAFQKELSDLEALFFDITGAQMPKFYRPPQGIYSEDNLAMAQEMGYKTVFWSLAYVDWKQDAQPTREQALQKLLPRTHDGAIILLHSTSHTNADILDELLTTWEQQGYTFGNIQDLFEEKT